MSYEANTDMESGAVHAIGTSSPFEYFVDGINALGSVLIMVVMLLMCADVLARNMLNAPIHGVAELVAMSIIVIVFLQLASTLRHGRMSRADIFIDHFAEKHPAAGNGLLAIFHLAGACMCLVILYATLPVFMKAWQGNEYIGVEGVFTSPTWPVRLVVIIGTATAAIQYLILVVTHMRRGYGTSLIGGTQ